MDATGGFERLDSARTPGLHARAGTRRAFTRARLQAAVLLSAEGDNIWFLYKDDAHVER